MRADLDRADAFVCVGCKRRVPSSFGCDDDMPNHCDDCWHHARCLATDSTGHEHGFDRSFVTWYDATGTPTDAEHGVSRRCLYCGEWQGLGPAADAPAHELEAAELIAHYERHGADWRGCAIGGWEELL